MGTLRVCCRQSASLVRGELNGQSQSCFINEALESQADELSLAVAEDSSESDSTSRTDGLSPLLDVAEMRPRNSQLPGKMSLGHLLAKPDREKEIPQGEWASRHGFEKRHCLTLFLNSHVWLPLQLRRTQRLRL